jgi:hypothetical protein
MGVPDKSKVTPFLLAYCGKELQIPPPTEYKSCYRRDGGVVHFVYRVQLKPSRERSNILGRRADAALRCRHSIAVDVSVT